MPPSVPTLAVIAGPTASGKSALALRLAKARGGVIINADASQCYADLRILSARPAAAEIEEVPHRLYGFLSVDAAMNAAAWAALARREIADAHTEGRLPIVVGGTGLYFRTLLHGIAPVPDVDAEVRAAVRMLPANALAAALAAEDPVMAARLRPSDTQRLARALEVVRGTGRSLADFHAATSGGLGDSITLEALVVDIDRAQLVARCDARFDAMIAAGALGEVERLAAMCDDASRPIMKAIGVPPLMAYLAGAVTLDEAVTRAKLDTRRYAKRQLTWFRNQTPDWPRHRP